MLGSITGMSLVQALRTDSPCPLIISCICATLSLSICLFLPWNGWLLGPISSHSGLISYWALIIRPCFRHGWMDRPNGSQSRSDRLDSFLISIIFCWIRIFFPLRFFPTLTLLRDLPIQRGLSPRKAWIGDGCENSAHLVKKMSSLSGGGFNVRTFSRSLDLCSSFSQSSNDLLFA